MGPHEGISVFMRGKKKERETRAVFLSAMGEKEHGREDSKKTAVCNLGGGPYRNPTTLASWSGISSLQNCEN